MNRLGLQELENYIQTIDASRYAERRNYLGGSTELSEYITRGAISLPRVRDLLLTNNPPESAYKLLNELAWREYWHMVWRIRGDDIFDYIRPLNGPKRNGIPKAILDASTGIKAIDDGIKQLQQTGYIHNHMRLWLAGLICNVAQCDWKVGADWMHSYLIDGDYASNHLSWQWVAGSYTGKAYLPQQDNINTFSETVQRNTFLDQPYEVITDMTVPEVLSVIDRPGAHSSLLPASTINLEALANESEILLYSPWTLDPLWRSDSTAMRVLLLDELKFCAGNFSQNVIDSLMWFTNQIPDIKIIRSTPEKLDQLPAVISRKYYAGITDWPGQVAQPELLYPLVESKFYPSFSAFWKQAQQS